MFGRFGMKKYGDFNKKSDDEIVFAHFVYGAPRQEEVIEEIVVTSHEQGKWKEIPFKMALELTGCSLWSDRSGDYYFSKESPGVFYDVISSPPAFIRFEHNRVLKMVRMLKLNQLIAVQKTIR